MWHELSILLNFSSFILIFSGKWVWLTKSGHCLEMFAQVIFSFYFIKDSLLINLETMSWAPDMADNNILYIPGIALTIVSNYYLCLLCLSH